MLTNRFLELVNWLLVKGLLYPTNGSLLHGLLDMANGFLDLVNGLLDLVNWLLVNRL